MNNEKVKIIISGGGTGGHIFPALSIANALRKADAGIDILFVGAQNRMEMEKVPAAGYRIIGLPVAGFYRKKLYRNIPVLFKLMKSILQARRIVKDFKPDAVVGVGGYASGPMLWAAARAGIPTVIQEQNSYAGVTNRILSKKAVRIFTAYDGMERFFPADRIIMAGNPVRQGLDDTARLRDEARRFFGLDAGKITILSIGGSLGARTINRAIASSLDEIHRSGVQFIWQSGGFYYKDAKEQLDASGASNIKLFDFISRMDYAYAAADIVISRAGASSISELCIAGKPSILVPSPNVAEDHQTKNALALASKDAAVMIKDSAAETELIKAALALSDDAEKCRTLEHNISALALKNSADRIAEEILSMVKASNA